MAMRLFLNDFHCDEKLVLRAIALKNSESSPEEALASLKKEATVKKAKSNLHGHVYSLNISINFVASTTILINYRGLMTTTEALPLIHAPWPQYSAQVLEKACEENRLEELLTELVCDIINNSSISDEIKFETGCRAICMIPPQQSAFVKKISTALKAKGFWALAKNSWPAPKRSYNQALLQAQKEAVKRKNLPAALKLISKSKSVKQSLIRAVLDHLPDEKLIRSVARRDFSNFSNWFKSLAEEDKSLFFAGGYRFIDPNGEENSAILDLFRNYGVEQRNRLFHIAPQLITPCDEVADLEVILKTLSEIDAEQQPECADAAALLCYDGLSGADKVALIKAVADLPAGRRSSLCKSASMLNLRSIKLRRFRKKISKIEIEPSIKKSVVRGLSEKTPDIFSYKRVIAILESLIQLEASQFAEKITAIKLHLDASQLLNGGHLESKAICDIIEGVQRGIPLSGIPACLMEIRETDRESVIPIYWKRFADVPEGDRIAVLSLLARISETERKCVLDFFKVSYSPLWGYSQLFGKCPAYNNPKKNILEAISAIPAGEIKEVLLSAKKLMRLFQAQIDHCEYIKVALILQKGNRCELIKKISQMRNWKPKDFRKIATGLLPLISKFRPEEFTKDVFDVLYRFETSFKHLYNGNNADIFRGLTTLTPGQFSQLSFYYTYEAIDLLGQQGLKQAVEIAETNGGTFDTSVVKATLAKDGSILERALERLRLRLVSEDQPEQVCAVSMIVRLFIYDFHRNEKLVLEAASVIDTGLSPNEFLIQLKEEAPAEKAKSSLHGHVYSLNIFQ